MGYGSYFVIVKGKQKHCGYSVPATCEQSRCKTKINRGLSYACGGEPGEMDDHCGSYFCGDHLYFTKDTYSEWHWYCEACSKELCGIVNQER